MKNFLSFLIALLTAVSGVTVGQINESNIEEYLNPDCESVSEFIVENLSELGKEYNNTLEEGELSFNATSCEFSIPVHITTTNQDAVYLDFDGNNGYMIVADEYNVIACETTGDLEYLKGLENTYYSLFDGFVYYEDGKTVAFNRPTYTQEEIDEFLKTELKGSDSYDGQSTKGDDGEIYDPDKYVADRYDSDYKVDEENLLKDFDYILQYNLSSYYNYVDGRKFSEGNCSLVSAYVVLNYLRKIGKYPTLPNDNVWVDATRDSFYSKYNKDADYDVHEKKLLPRLYKEIRDYCIKEFGYEFDGTNPFNITDIIEDNARKFGARVTADHHIIYSFEDEVVDQIDKGYPSLWNMAMSSTYGDHTTVVTGYKVYKKVKKILGIKFNSYVKLLALHDNWNSSVRYFDYSTYYGIGSFITVH